MVFDSDPDDARPSLTPGEIFLVRLPDARLAFRWVTPKGNLWEVYSESEERQGQRPSPRPLGDANVLGRVLHWVADLSPLSKVGGPSETNADRDIQHTEL